MNLWRAIFPADGFIHWRRLIVINAGIVLGYAISKSIRDVPDVEYVHLLVNYHFGFTKRALIGAAVSLFTDRVSPWMVYVLGGAMLLMTIGLYLRLFDKTFGFSRATAPLLCFIIGSPFFFKNFVKTIGYFDIYGCTFAIVLLLLPARSFVYVVIAAAGSIVLLLIHHIHMLLYVPTIGAIVLIRYYLAGRRSRIDMLLTAAMAVVVAGIFLVIMGYGNTGVSSEEFATYLKERIGAGGNPDKALEFAFIWHRTLTDELRDTWAAMAMNLSRVWVYPLLIALHAPLLRYYRCSIGAISSPAHRRAVMATLAGITLGYVVIGLVVFDYGRWVSSWAVCMILMLHAIKRLPADTQVPPIALDDRLALGCAMLLTVIPRVGIIRPF